MPSPSIKRSPLDNPPIELAVRPFFDLTVALLRAVSEHDYDRLAELCDDDFGIVDVDPSGHSVAIRSRREWKQWFDGLFATLTDLGAETDSEITAYESVVAADLGYSVVEFRQYLDVAGVVSTFHCVATIVWKRKHKVWREARWHVSVLSSDVRT